MATMSILKSKRRSRKKTMTTPPTPTSRLWRVTVEYTLLVVADNEREAATEAEYYAGEDGSEPDMSIAHQVCSIEDVPNEWRNSIPFGGDRKDERTCRERVTPNDRISRERSELAESDGSTSGGK